MYLLSFCPMHAKIMIMVCSITYRIFMLQIWSLILREGHKLNVFNTSVLRMLGSNIREVMGRLVKLHYSFFICLNQMFCIDLMIMLW